jgi:Tol biopolymer transport system component/DNA-binding winged helix-turn-helix (wHTH) protein
MTLETKRIYEFGPFRLDAAQRILWQGDHLVPLTPKVLETLLVLVESHGRLVEKAELMDKVWPGTAVEEGNLTFNVSLLRRVLGDDRQNGNRYIDTVPRRGYRFVAPVTVREPEGAVTAKPVEIVQLAAEGNAGSRTRRRVALHLGLAAFLGTAAFTYWLGRPQPTPRILRYTELTSDFRDKGGRLVTDGAYIYFTEDSANGTAIAFVSVHGGQPRMMQTPVQIKALADINPDRSEILAIGSRRGNLESKPWAIALPSGSARLEADFDVAAACWSPDGARMAYASGTDLYVSGRDGTKSAKLATFPGLVGDIRWSPDGKALRFAVNEGRAGVVELWEIETNGKRRRPLLGGRSRPSREYDGAWTPAGTWFAFVSERDGRQELWTLGRKAGSPHTAISGPTQLASGLTNFSSPVFSRDGKTLFALGHQVHGNLVRYDPARGEFASFLEGIWADSVSFTKDGQWVAYRTWPERVLWRARADNTQKVQLTFPPAEADGASWSPDGKRIAFRLRKPGKPYKIHIIAADGGEPQELLPEDPQEEGIPTWSADGKRLAFGEVAANFGHATGKEMVHVCDLDTHSASAVPGSEGLWTSRWSPDGRYISAVTADKRQRLMLFDFTTHRWRDLGAENVNSPTWSHGSKYIYYDVLGAGGAPAIMRVRVNDGRREQVVNLDGFKRGANWWSGLALDDSPLVVRDAGMQEIYALDVEWPLCCHSRSIQSSSNCSTDRNSGSPVTRGQLYFWERAAAKASAYEIGNSAFSDAACQISSIVGTSILTGKLREDSRQDSARSGLWCFRRK